MEHRSLPDVTLRPVEPSDLDLLFILETDLYRGGASFMSAPPSRQLLYNYIDSYSADIYAERQLRLIACDAASGQTVGIADLSDYEPHDRRAFVGIAVLPHMRDFGYGTAILGALSDYAFGSLGMHSLAAQIAADNDVSIRAFRRAGFKSCGKLRSWLRRGRHYADALIFQKLAE